MGALYCIGKERYSQCFKVIFFLSSCTQKILNSSSRLDVEEARAVSSIPTSSLSPMGQLLMNFRYFVIISSSLGSLEEL